MNGAKISASRSRDSVGYGLALIGAMMFSFKAVLAKLAFVPVGGTSESVEVAIDPLTLMVLRLGFALPVYLLIGWRALVVRKRSTGQTLRPRDTLQITLLGVMCFYVCAWLDFSGLQYITAQLERLILFTYPVFVLIFGALFFGGRISLWGALAVLMAYAGIALIFAAGSIAVGSNVPLGSALVFSAAIVFAFYQLLSKSVIDRFGPQLFTCVAMIGAAFATGVHFLILHGGVEGAVAALDLPVRLYVLGLAIAIVATILPSFMIASAVARVGPQAVAIVAMAGPVATIIGSVVLLGEPFGWIDAVGTLVTISGIAFYTVIDKRARIKARSTDPEFIR